jgi:hypothetical protein
MVPALDDRLISDQAATYSVNGYLYSGKLIGLPSPKILRALDAPATGKVFRIPSDYGNAAYPFESTWMEFENSETDIIRAPVFDDEYDRYYWASSSLPARYNTYARIVNGDPAWLLGIPTPGTLPSLSVVGGSGTTITRAYVYTWVSAYGEESAPSPPRTVTGFVNGSWNLSWAAAAAGDLGVNRNLTHTRIYRTITSSTGVATFFFVAEVPIATLVYSDTLADTLVANQGSLETVDWTPPPDDLQGFAMMPNGIVASWRSNELWFSEPFRPHAWPTVYVHTVEYPIVGLGVANQTLIVCTAGHPIAASGSTPGAITSSKLTNFEPCLSRGSILSAPEGVYYASPNGLILVAEGNAQNITRTLITRDKWKQITGAGKLRAARFGTAYYAYGSIVQGVFEEDAFDVGNGFTEEDFTGALNGVLIDPFDGRVAFNLLQNDDPIVVVQNDQWSGDIYRIVDGNVEWIDQSDTSVLPEVAIWRSKIFQSETIGNVGAVKIYFSVPTGTTELNPVRNTALVQELAADQYGLFRLYADDRHVMTRELRKSGELFKPPSGFKADFWQFEIETRVKILSVDLAPTVRQLKELYVGQQDAA